MLRLFPFLRGGTFATTPLQSWATGVHYYFSARPVVCVWLRPKVVVRVHPERLWQNLRLTLLFDCGFNAVC